MTTTFRATPSLLCLGKTKQQLIISCDSFPSILPKSHIVLLPFHFTTVIFSLRVNKISIHKTVKPKFCGVLFNRYHKKSLGKS